MSAQPFGGKSCMSVLLIAPGCCALQEGAWPSQACVSLLQISSKQLRDDLMTMLIAGHETTAAVLTWTMYCLSKHPEYIQRIQAEVRGPVSCSCNAHPTGDLKIVFLSGPYEFSLAV